MKKHLYKIISLIVGSVIMFSSLFAFPSQATESDFSMKPFDKAYVTFLFDDGRMPFTKECFEIFKEYNMPMCCDVVANRIDDSLLDVLLKIQSAGGEILSHTYSHNALTSSNSNIANIEKELGDSFRVLTGLGFNINGVVETGNGGGEKTANYELIETISRKYYKYSNAYGVSPQYNMPRTWMATGINQPKPLSSIKSSVYNAITKKEWIVLWAHDFSEISKGDMRELLEYIDGYGKNKVEVVTWNYIYENFGNYTGPQVPTKEAIESVCTTQGHDLKNPVVHKAADCENGPVMKGECKRCGKTGTYQSKSGALGHKFGKYVSDNNADCYNLSTKTAKCTRKGCKATDTQTDFDSVWKHKLKTFTVKEATSTTEGLAEVKCTLCGQLEKTVVIPKGKDAEDVVTLEPEKNNTSSTNSSNSQSSNKNDATNTIGGSVPEQGTNSEPHQAQSKVTFKTKTQIATIHLPQSKTVLKKDKTQTPHQITIQLLKNLQK